jgi:hypothetical protein
MQSGRAPMPPLAGLCDDHLREAIVRTVETCNTDENQALLVNIWRKIETSEKRQMLRDWLDRTWLRFVSALGGITACDRCGCHDNNERMLLISNEGESKLRDVALVLVRCSMLATDMPASWSPANVTWWKNSGKKLQSLSRLKWLGSFMQSVVNKHTGGPRCIDSGLDLDLDRRSVFTLAIQPMIDANRDYDLYAVMR